MTKTFESNWTVHSDAMLSNVKYYNTKDGEFFIPIWKDLTSKNKDNNIEIIIEPEVPVYFTKPEFRKGGNLYMQSLDKLDMQTIRPSQIPRLIAQQMGPHGMAVYNRIVQARDWRAMKEIYKWPYSFGADYPPEMFYRIWWMENCSNDLTPYVKPVFSDIEVDIIDRKVNSIEMMIEEGTDPINIISIYYKHENEMQIYIMIPDGKMGGNLASKQLKDYVDLRNNWDGFIKEIHDIFDKTYGKIKYVFNWYHRDEELKMLIDYFTLINNRRPDFVGFWNMSFDMPYMMRRIEVLGADPKDVICDPNFPTKELRFKKDVRHFDLKENGDFLFSSTVPQYICLMRTYAKHRKQKLFPSYSLDAISEYELGEHKLKYGEDGENIKNLAYMDFKKFILYNIKDTLLTKQIDEVTADCEYTWICSNQNLTNYESIFSPSLSLRNVVYNELLRQAIGEY